MQDRIHQLRTALGLSQEELASRIGLSKSGISNIENGKRTLIDRNIKLLCSEFNVNEQWLRTGIGEMFNQSTQPVWQELTTKYHLSETDENILRAFCELPSESRTVIKDFILRVADKPETVTLRAVSRGGENTEVTIQTTKEKADADIQRLLDSQSEDPDF